MLVFCKSLINYLRQSEPSKVWCETWDVLTGTVSDIIRAVSDKVTRH